MEVGLHSAFLVGAAVEAAVHPRIQAWEVEVGAHHSQSQAWVEVEEEHCSRIQELEVEEVVDHHRSQA